MASSLMTSAEDLGTPGIRFSPTKQELVGHYLPHKIRSNDNLVSPIAEIDYICNYEPWDLPFLAAIPSKTVNLEVDEVDPGHYSASEVGNPVIDISSPVMDSQFMAEFLDFNGQDFTSPIAQQPVMHMSQGPSYVNLQHANGVTDDYTRSLSQFGNIDQQFNNTEAVKLYPADAHLYYTSHAAPDESGPSEDILASDACLPEMLMMQGLSYENLQQTNCIADEFNLMESYPAIQDVHSYRGSMQIAPSDSSLSELLGSLHAEDISGTEPVNPLFTCFEVALGVIMIGFVIGRLSLLQHIFPRQENSER